MGRKKSSEGREEKMKFVICWVLPQRRQNLRQLTQESSTTHEPEGANTVPDNPTGTMDDRPVVEKDENGQS